MLQLIVLARLLKPQDFGLMGLVTVVIGLAQIVSDFGISNALVYRREVTKEQLSSLYWLNLAVGSLLFLILFGAAPVVSDIFGEPRLTDPMRIATLVFLIAPFGVQFQSMLQKELGFAYLSKIEMISAAISSAVAIVAAVMGFGIYSLVLGQVSLTIAKTALLVRVGWSRWRPMLHFCHADLPGYLGFGLYQTGDRMLNFVSSNMDKILIVKLIGIDLLGYYTMATNLVYRPMLLINPVLTRVAFPAFASIQDDDARIRRGYSVIIKLIALIAIPLYVGLAISAEPLIITLFGDAWRSSITIFQILCIRGVIASLGNPIGSLLLAKGKANVGFWMTFIALAVYTVAILGGSRWGGEGVAWGIVLAALVVLFPFEFWIRWIVVRARPLEYIASLIPAIGIAVLIAPTLYAVSWLIQPQDQAVRLVSLLATGMLAYIGSVWLFQRSIIQQTVSLLVNRGK